MLDYHEENRPTLEQILANNYMNFEVPIDLQSYTKPKTNILP